MGFDPHEKLTAEMQRHRASKSTFDDPVLLLVIRIIAKILFIFYALSAFLRFKLSLC